MAIEVLLRRSIEGVGGVGQVVRVREGYARNYLLPYSLAALVTPESMRNVEKDKAAEAVREAAEAVERAALTEKLAKVELRIECRAGEDGHLYGSVGARQVVDALKRLGFRFEERQIRFEPVRQLGEYEVPIHLTRQQDVKVRLLVVLDAEDAKAHAEAAAQRADEEAQAARYAAEHGLPPPGAAAPEPVVAEAEEEPAEGKKGGKKGKRKGGEEAAKPEEAAKAESKPEASAKEGKGGKGGEGKGASKAAEEKGGESDKAEKSEKKGKGKK